jgi:hypothetical protein
MEAFLKDYERFPFQFPLPGNGFYAFYAGNGAFIAAMDTPGWRDLLLGSKSQDAAQLLNAVPEIEWERW